MFRPAKILHTIVVLPKNKVDNSITELHESGICELKASKIDLSMVYEPERAKRIHIIDQRLQFVKNSLKPYEEIVQPEKLLKSLFAPSPPVKEKIYLRKNKEILEELERHLDIIEPKVKANLEKLSELNEKINQNNFLISNLRLLPSIKTTLFKSTDNIKTLLGVVPTLGLIKIKEKLSKKSLILHDKINKNQSLIAIFSLPDDITYINKLLHEIGFEVLDITYEDKEPKEIINTLKSNNEELQQKIREIKKALEKIERHYHQRLLILSEELEICMGKINALKEFKASNSFSVFEAWVPGKNFEEFHSVIKKISEHYYIEIKENDDAPTLYNNPKLVAPFELITNLYSPPKHGRFDPTFLLAITFSMFFGLMLGDFVYGLILMVLAILMLRGLGKYDPAMKNFSIILIFFGISTLIFGFIFGSYFGDFFEKIGIKLPMFIDSLTDVIITLSIVVTIGALHMGIGLLIGFLENKKFVSLREALARQGVWLLFLIGIVLILLKGIFIKIGLGVIGLSVLMQLFFNFQEGGAINSVLSIFSYTSFIGDAFSYARLMALGVGTAGIALAVNFLTLLSIKIPIIGIIFGIIIFLIGHTFNMLMSGLGAFVHSTRLHFLEYFQKFYYGGGKLYKPFKAERKYTYVENQ